MEQARFQQQRNEGAGGRNSALTFGADPFSSVNMLSRALVCSLLTPSSHHRNGAGRLLSRHPQLPHPVLRLDAPALADQSP